MKSRLQPRAWQTMVKLAALARRATMFGVNNVLVMAKRQPGEQATSLT